MILSGDCEPLKLIEFTLELSIWGVDKDSMRAAKWYFHQLNSFYGLSPQSEPRASYVNAALLHDFVADFVLDSGLAHPWSVLDLFRTRSSGLT